MEKNNVISARLLDYFGSLKSYLNQPSVYEARPLSEVTERQWGTLLRKLSTEKKKKKSDGMVYRQLSGKAAYQQNLSTLSFDREGTPIGVILFSDDGKDLSVDYLWVGGERGKVLVSLLKQSLLSAGKRKFPPDTLVICHAANPTVEQMIEKRLGKEKVKKVPAKAAILDL